MTINHPCGHEADFDASVIARDRFQCPACGLRWRVRTAPPRLLPSGFVMPGDRAIEIEARPRRLRGLALSMKPRR